MGFDTKYIRMLCVLFKILRFLLLFLKKYVMIFLWKKEARFMKLCNLIKYGLFNTNTTFPGKKQTAERDVDCFEIEYFLSTTGKAIINGRSYEIAPGTLLCAKPGQKRMSVLGFQCYFLHIRFSEDSPYQKMLEQTPDYFQIVDSDAYGRLFESLVVHLLGEGYNPESDFVNARLLELFYYLRKDTQKNLNCPELFDKSRHRFIPQTVNYIRENYPRHLTLKDMASAVGYSPNYFHHVFTTVMGKTPQQYLLEERIRQSKLLLVQSEKTLSEIAYECGFSSQSHFSMQFKKMTYSTPGQYRQRNLDRYGVEF